MSDHTDTQTTMVPRPVFHTKGDFKLTRNYEDIKWGKYEYIKDKEDNQLLTVTSNIPYNIVTLDGKPTCGKLRYALTDALVFIKSHTSNFRNSEPIPTLFEGIHGNMPSKMYFDIDIDFDKHPGLSDDQTYWGNYVRDVIHCFKSFNYGKQWDCIVCTSHGKSKLSYHLIFDRISFTGDKALMYVRNSIVERLEIEHGYTKEESSLLDPVYNKFRSFRLLWSAKVNSNRSKIFAFVAIPDVGGIKELNIDSYRVHTKSKGANNVDGDGVYLRLFEASLVSFTHGCTNAVNVILPEVPKTKFNLIAGDITHSEGVEAYQMFVDKYGDDWIIKDGGITDNTVILVRKIQGMECYCPSHDRTHGSQNILLSIKCDNKYSVFTGCYHKDKAKKNICIGYLRPDEETQKVERISINLSTGKEEKVEWTPEDKAKWLLAKNTRIVNNFIDECQVDDPNVYISETNRIKPHKFDARKHNIVIAPTGTGKTYQIRNLLRSNPTWKVLIISVCRLFAYDAAANYRSTIKDGDGNIDKGFTVANYLDDNYINNTNAQIHIVSPESLYKLTIIPDLLVIDEVASIIPLFTKHGFHGDHYKNNKSMFHNLLQSVEYVIGMDADTNTFTIEFMGDIRGQSPKIDILTVKRYCEIYMVPEFEELLKLLIIDIYELKRLYITCATCSKANFLFNFCKIVGKHFNKEILVKLITSNTPDDKDFYSNINEYTKQFNILIVTNTIGAGVDIMTPFDKLYVMSICNTVSVNRMYQMMARVRNFNQIEIVWFHDTSFTPKTPLSITASDFVKAAKGRDELATSLRKIFIKTIKFGKWELDLRGDAYKKHQLFELREQNINKMCWPILFQKLGEKKGYAFIKVKVSPVYDILKDFILHTVTATTLMDTNMVTFIIENPELNVTSARTRIEKGIASDIDKKIVKIKALEDHIIIESTKYKDPNDHILGDFDYIDITQKRNEVKWWNNIRIEKEKEGVYIDHLLYMTDGKLDIRNHQRIPMILTIKFLIYILKIPSTFSYGAIIDIKNIDTAILWVLKNYKTIIECFPIKRYPMGHTITTANGLTMLRTIFKSWSGTLFKSYSSVKKINGKTKKVINGYIIDYSKPFDIFVKNLHTQKSYTFHTSYTEPTGLCKIINVAELGELNLEEQLEYLLY